jgi:alpha-tubulin suppressor-like RCC1 family protein
MLTARRSVRVVGSLWVTLVAAVGLVLGLVVAPAATASGAGASEASTATADASSAGNASGSTAVDPVAYINAQNTGNVKQVSASEWHACAVTEAGAAYCWGNAWLGGLGNGKTNQQNTPVRVCATEVTDDSGSCGGEFLSQVSQVSVGGTHSCAVTDETGAGGTVYCWGGGTSGQLGNDSRDDSSVPVKVSDKNGFSQGSVRSVSAGDNHSCAVTDADAAFCWGLNSYGQLGNGKEANEPVPVRVCAAGVTDGSGSCGGEYLPNVSQVTTGAYYTCAVAAGSAFCWGGSRTNYGQLGNGDTTNSSVPVKVADGTEGFKNGSVSQVSAGANTTCAVTTSGTDSTVYCWGDNAQGQLGNGKYANQGGGEDSNVPVKVLNGTEGFENGSVSQVSAGGTTTCAVTTEGYAYCWGWNSSGNLGNGSATGSGTRETVPVQVCDAIIEPSTNSGGCKGKYLSEVSQVSNGTDLACAVTDAGAAYCWGNGQYGQFGNGDPLGNSNKPVAVTYPGEFTVNPNELEFGKVEVGGQKGKEFTLFSTFSEDVVVDATVTQVTPYIEAFLPPALCGVDAKVVALVPPAGDAGPGECQGYAVFTAEQKGSHSATVELMPYNNVGIDNPKPGDTPLAGGAIEFTMSGYTECRKKCGAVVLAEPNPVTFGTVEVGDVKTKKFTITNDGDKPLDIDKVQVPKEYDDEFDVADTGQCLDGEIQPDKSCVVKVRFFPREDGSAAGLVKIVSESDGSPNSVGLSGTGELVIVPDDDGDLDPPGKVRKLKAASKSLSCRAATVSWKEPKDSGSAPVTSYDVRIKKNGEWKKWKSTDWVPNANNKITKRYKKLTPKTMYKVQVRAVSAVGAGEKKTVKFKTPRCGVPTKPGNG